MKRYWVSGLLKHEGEEDLGGRESLGWTLKCQRIKISKI